MQRNLALLIQLLALFILYINCCTNATAKSLDPPVSHKTGSHSHFKQIGGDCTFKGGRVTTADVKRIRQSGLYSLTFEDCEIDETVISELLKKTVPVTLHARHCVVGQWPNNRDWYANLSYITMNNCNVRDGDISFLRHCNHLKWLNLSSNPIQGRFLIHLGDAKELEQLLLRDTLVDSENAALISKISQLKILDLDQTPCSPATVRSLEPLKQLKRLRVPYHSEPDRWWSSLRAANHIIEELATKNFHNCALSDKAFEQHSTLDHKNLNLAGTRITDRSIQTTNFPNIKTLNLSNCRVSGEYLTEDRMPVLEVLKLNECSLTKKGIAIIGKHPRLVSLEISGSLPADEGRLLGLSGSKLQSLDLSGNTSLDVADILGLKACSWLKELSLAKITLFPELLKAVSLIESLTTLSLDQCNGFDQRSLDQLARLGRLRQLSVVQAALSEQQLKSLKNALPDCNIISKPQSSSERWTTTGGFAEPNELP